MANYKICLDAGHYGKYNQSPAVPAYYESDMNWKLHLLLKKYLEEYGFEVITTRTNQATDLGLTARGRKSAGCDFFISLHSNAVGSYVKESVDFPAVFVPLNGTGDKLGKLLADCIAEVMETNQPGDIFKKRGNNGDYYGVIRGAVSVGTPGIILEHSFHTNTRATNWLLNDNNLDMMAKAEAKVIAEYFGVYKQGDVNLDGEVSISDVTALLNMLSGKSETTPTADVNEDGEVTISDTTALLNLLSGPNKEEKTTNDEKETTVMIELTQIKNGSKCAEVKTMQRLLNALGYKGSNGKVLTVDGIFGANSDYAVKAFQKANGLIVDGIVGKNTWNKLLK